MTQTTEKVAPDYFQDYLNLQAALKNPVKDTAGYADRYHYAQLPDILDQVKPVLAQHNFALFNEIYDGVVVVSLKHVSGTVTVSGLQIPDYGTDAQKLGSFITYARRYSTLVVLNLSAEDDDGEATTSKPGQISSSTASKSSGDIKVGYRGKHYTFRQGTGKTGNPYKAWKCIEDSSIYFESAPQYQEISTKAKAELIAAKYGAQEPGTEVDPDDIPEDFGDQDLNAVR